MALCAGGRAPNITALLSRESVALVSGQCGVPQWPDTTKLSRGFGKQRGHAGRPVFLIERRCALWASPPSITAFVLPALLCQSVRAALLRPAQVSGRYIASASQVLVSALVRRYGLGSLAHRAGSAVACGSACRRVRGSCDTRPLRPLASLLHNAALPSVPASRCAWCRSPLRALRVKVTGVMQSGLYWNRSHSHQCFPVVGTPYAPPSTHPCGCRSTVALVRRCALCGWSVACGQSCRVCPRAPWLLCFATN